MKSENYGSVVQKAVEQIKQFLFTSDLKKGEHLPTEKELCQQLGVGRNSLREALRILASTGYITLEPGRGAFVRRTGETDSGRPSVTGTARARVDCGLSHRCSGKAAMPPPSQRRPIPKRR